MPQIEMRARLLSGGDGAFLRARNETTNANHDSITTVNTIVGRKSRLSIIPSVRLQNGPLAKAESFFEFSVAAGHRKRKDGITHAFNARDFMTAPGFNLRGRIPSLRLEVLNPAVRPTITV